MVSSLLRNLFARRVPQIVGVYLGASWGALQFLDWAVDRYVLSPHLPDFGLAVTAALLPSVLLLAYFRGRPGGDDWTRLELVGVPANLVLAGALLVYFFGGKDLGAATTTVTVETEAGEEVERVVPKAEFRKRFVLFDFDNVGSDTAADWLQYGIPTGLVTDLHQDLFVDVVFPPLFREELRRAGHGDGLDVPQSLKRKIADDHHASHFVTGTVDREGDEIRVTVELHDTERGGVVTTRSVSSADPYRIVDSLSVLLRRDLGVPAHHLETVQDLPLAEIETQDRGAFRLSALAYEALVVRDDWQRAAELLEEAIRRDSTYASAQYGLYATLMLGSQSQKALVPLEAAMEHLYRLPERAQFAVKADYYYTRQEPEKALAVAEMWVELLPQDIQGRRMLGMLYEHADRRADAIAQYEEIVRLNPGQADLLRTIGDLERRRGEFERALDAYSRYADRFPEDPDAHISLARLYRTRGLLDDALAAYERATLADPSDVDAHLGLARLHRYRGEFAEARAALETAEERARTAEERSRVYDARAGHLEFRGRRQEGLAYREREVQEYASFMAPVLYLSQKGGLAAKYAKAGRVDRARAILDSLANQLQSPWDGFLHLAALGVYLAVEEPDSAEAALARTEEFLGRFQLRAFDDFLHYARGRIHEFRGEYAAAVAAYRQERELDPSDPEIPVQLGRCLRELGRLAEAEESLREGLRLTPASPTALYELALVYEAKGEAARALEQLERALEIWSGADPEYEFARKARTKLAELTRS